MRVGAVCLLVLGLSFVCVLVGCGGAADKAKQEQAAKHEKDMKEIPKTKFSEAADPMTTGVMIDPRKKGRGTK